MSDSGKTAPTEGFGPESRLKKRGEFMAMQARGQRVHTPSFVVLESPRADRARRIGITVTKKIGCAVERNRVKRLVREVFRRRRDLFPEGVDVVVIAKSGAPSLAYGDVLAQSERAAPALRSAAEKARRRRAEAEAC